MEERFSIYDFFKPSKTVTLSVISDQLGNSPSVDCLKNDKKAGSSIEHSEVAESEAMTSIAELVDDESRMKKPDSLESIGKEIEKADSLGSLVEELEMAISQSVLETVNPDDNAVKSDSVKGCDNDIIDKV